MSGVKRAAVDYVSATQDTAVRNVRAKRMPRCPKCSGPLVNAYTSTTCMHSVCGACATTRMGDRVCPEFGCARRVETLVVNAELRTMLRDAYTDEYDAAVERHKEGRTLGEHLQYLGHVLGNKVAVLPGYEFRDENVRVFLRLVERVILAGRRVTARDRIGVFDDAVKHIRFAPLAVTYATDPSQAHSITVSVHDPHSKVCSITVDTNHRFTFIGGEPDGGEIGSFLD